MSSIMSSRDGWLSGWPAWIDWLSEYPFNNSTNETTNGTTTDFPITIFSTVLFSLSTDESTTPAFTNESTTEIPTTNQTWTTTEESTQSTPLTVTTTMASVSQSREQFYIIHGIILVLLFLAFIGVLVTAVIKRKQIDSKMYENELEKEEPKTELLNRLKSTRMPI